MNRYLLDTHILLWWLADDEKLNKKRRDIIGESTNQILVSAASIWEIVIKKALNKLTAPDNLKEVLFHNNFETLPITVDHVLGLDDLPPIHNDPFDRLLIAQSITENLALITADPIIAQYEAKII